MQIYINSNNEIKAINETTDITLQEVEIDRESLFGNMSDFMILNYKYIQYENGSSICPVRNYDELLYLENREIIKESQNKISILESENEKLKKVSKAQDELLADSVYKISMLEIQNL